MFLLPLFLEKQATTMEVIVNNQRHTTTAPNLLDLIQELQIESRGVAIAINNSVVSQSKWGETPMHEGDRVVVVSAVFGG